MLLVAIARPLGCFDDGKAIIHALGDIRNDMTCLHGDLCRNLDVYGNAMEQRATS